MMINCGINKQQCKAKANMKTAREGTFAWRLMLEREKKGLSQVELSEELTRRLKGKKVAPPTPMTVSKMERGIIVTPKHEVLEGLSEIFRCTIDYLVTGKEPEPEPDQFVTPEANTVGTMIDAMLPRSRRIMVIVADGLLAADTEQNESDVRIAELLQENITLMSNGQRSVADEYILRTETTRRRLNAHPKR